MTEVIERVAIAIRRKKFERTGRVAVFDPSMVTEAELGEARAAIEAMREPTDEMANKAECAEPFSFEAMWKAAIDEALRVRS